MSEAEGGEDTLGRLMRVYDGRVLRGAVLALIAGAAVPLGRGREGFPPFSDPLGLCEPRDVFQASDLAANGPIEACR